MKEELQYKIEKKSYNEKMKLVWNKIWTRENYFNEQVDQQSEYFSKKFKKLENMNKNLK